ncbi:MAG: HAD family hydrolase [Acidobacteriota bacterium]|jgi:phosphoglycolate phosphatase-like HAD superfamily hydrolase
MRLFLFDVDGTLVDVGGAGRAALERAFGEVFAVPDPRGLLQPIRFDGGTDQGILRVAVERAGLEPSRFRERRGEFDAAYLRHLRDILAGPPRGSGVLPGVLPLLESLQARGDALALMTGNSEAGARTKLAPFDLNRFFPVGAFGSDHEDRRALADLARRRVESRRRVRFEPVRVVVIGDSVMDVRAGKAHGFRTVAVLTGWTSREVLAAENPDRLCVDLRELPPEP